MTTDMANDATQETDIPVYIERSLDLRALLEKKSHFLFGPRQTGKSSLRVHSRDVTPESVLLQAASSQW